jgi:membrane DNA delivery protein
MNQITEGLVTIATAIVGVAILAVLVSKNSQTPAVLGAAGSAFSNALSAATGPVTGSVAAPVNNIGGSSSLGLGNVQMPTQMNWA